MHVYGVCRLHSRITANILVPRPSTYACQFRFVHHHKELEEPGGFERFIGWRRSNPHRANRNTHVNEAKYRRLRGEKRLLIELEDHVEQQHMKKMTPDQLRMYLLRKGKPNIYEDAAPREWQEHQITYQSLHDIITTYIPPETSKLSRLGSSGLSELFEDVKDYWKDRYAALMGYGLRRIRRKEGLRNFDLKEFVKEAEEIYESTFHALKNRDKVRLHGLVTESAFHKLWPDVEKGTLRWELVRFNEPSVVVSIRVTDIPPKSGNDIAQIAVRMHTTQKMAIYDKDGHLLLGAEDDPREVLEYVVFENHVASADGKWRFHGQVIPTWAKTKQTLHEKPMLVEKAKEKGDYPTELSRLHLDSGVKKKRKEAGEKMTG